MQQTFEILREREPNNGRWQSELGDAYDNLGKLALKKGQLSEAIVAYQNDQRIKSSLTLMRVARAKLDRRMQRAWLLFTVAPAIV